MTVYPMPYGSIEKMIFSLLVSFIIPLLIIYIIRKKWKTKNKFLGILISLIVFVIVFFIISTTLYLLFTPEVSYGIMCVPFEFYSENNTCKWHGEIINDSLDCKQLLEHSQSELSKKYCPSGTLFMGY